MGGGATMDAPRARDTLVEAVSSRRGLANLSNTCFLNATLQCLAATQPLADALVLGHCGAHGAPGRRGAPGRVRRGAPCAMRLVEQTVGALGRGGGSTHAPRELVSALPSLEGVQRGTFVRGRQEDAHEALRALLEGMQRACVREERAARGVSERVVSGADLIKERMSVPRQVFGGEVRSRVHCQVCGANSDTFEPFLDLSLEARYSSLEEALDAHTRAETLSGSNAYWCDRCRALVSAHKSVRVVRAPRVLAVHLKRFEGGIGGGGFGGFGSFGGFRSRGKVASHVQLPLCLELGAYMADAEQRRPANSRPGPYHLYAVLVHAGSGASSGHYYAFVRDAEGWWRADDSRVSRCSQEEALRAQAYIAFYSQDDARAAKGAHVPPSAVEEAPSQARVGARPPASMHVPVHSPVRAAAQPRSRGVCTDGAAGSAVALKRAEERARMLARARDTSLANGRVGSAHVAQARAYARAEASAHAAAHAHARAHARVSQQARVAPRCTGSASAASSATCRLPLPPLAHSHAHAQPEPARAPFGRRATLGLDSGGSASGESALTRSRERQRVAEAAHAARRKAAADGISAGTAGLGGGQRARSPQWLMGARARSRESVRDGGQALTRQAPSAGRRHNAASLRTSASSGSGPPLDLLRAPAYTRSTT